MPGCRSTGSYKGQTGTSAVVYILWLVFVFYSLESHFTDMENPFCPSASTLHSDTILILQFVIAPHYTHFSELDPIFTVNINEGMSFKTCGNPFK